MSNSVCCVCSSPMSIHATSWCLRCPECGTWASTLGIDINGAGHAALDEQLRAVGLAPLRDHNNAVILRRLAESGAAPGARLLDVGAAHGWFVSAARAAGFAAEGIEPDEAVATAARERSVPMRVGFFPDALDDDERFDVISFNDVIEHIPDVRRALADAHRHLAPGGLVSINIPNSRGAVYQVSRAMRRLGAPAVFDRLWQVGLPSPHVWYFDEPGLIRLCESVGLTPVYRGRLASMMRSGLWERAHFDRRPSLTTVASVAVGWTAAPILNARKASDVMHLIVSRARD